MLKEGVPKRAPRGNRTASFQQKKTDSDIRCTRKKEGSDENEQENIHVRTRGSFFNEKRTYTRHIRPREELTSSARASKDRDLRRRQPSESFSLYYDDDDDDDDGEQTVRGGAVFGAPVVSIQTRNKVSQLKPTDESHYVDPIGDAAPMPAVPDEIIQFEQDITSSKFRSLLQRKLATVDNIVDPLEDLFLDETAEESQEAVAQRRRRRRGSERVRREEEDRGKDKRRKSKDYVTGRADTATTMLFAAKTVTPPVPTSRFDHFLNIAKEARPSFEEHLYVQECVLQLQPYLYLKRSDWQSMQLSLLDTISIGCRTGFFFLHTQSAERTGRVIHLYSDTQPDPDQDSQLQTHNIMLHLVVTQTQAAQSCYYSIHCFFFTQASPGSLPLLV